jgi:uncharacterized protein YbjT (DUF2867 family)
VRVLVTGGLEFLGRAVVRELLDHGDQVVVLTRGRWRGQLPDSVEVQRIRHELGWAPHHTTPEPLIRDPWQARQAHAAKIS